MARCKRCGKSGFFFHVGKSGLCDSCAAIAEKHTLQLEEMKRKQQAEDKLVNEQLKRLNEARDKYEKDGQYDKLIAIYEEVLSSPTFFNAVRHKLLLVEYYQKNAQRDKAWALLNSIALEYPDEICRVRRAQYRQLKNEKNYPEALKMYFLYKFNDCRNIACWSEVKEKEYASFQKEAQILAKKAKLDTQSISGLTDVFIKLVETSRATESTALKEFKVWYRNAVK